MTTPIAQPTKTLAQGCWFYGEVTQRSAHNYQWRRKAHFWPNMAEGWPPLCGRRFMNPFTTAPNPPKEDYCQLCTKGVGDLTKEKERRAVQIPAWMRA